MIEWVTLLDYIRRLQFERTVLQNEVDGLKAELNEVSSVNLRYNLTMALMY